MAEEAAAPVAAHPESSSSERGAAVQDPPAVERSRWRGRALSDGTRLYWWKELLLVGSVYIVYESVRNLSKGKPPEAFANALRVIRWQEALGIYHEKAIQDWTLHFTPLVVLSNYYYGSAYIAFTVAILLWLYHRVPDDYALWRNTLAIGTLLGLIGFATFPLMPPRLLDHYVQGLGDSRVFGYVDTLVKYPTFWSFESSTMQKISNQYAAMPSLHCGWALWGAAVLIPRVRSSWMKALAVLYPITTVYVVVATGNHYLLDAVGGAAIFAVGYGIARLITRTGRGTRPSDAAMAPR